MNRAAADHGTELRSADTTDWSKTLCVRSWKGTNRGRPPNVADALSTVMRMTARPASGHQKAQTSADETLNPKPFNVPMLVLNPKP